MSQNKTIDYFLKAAWQSVANKYNNIATQYGFTQAAGYILINIHREGTPVSQIANSTGVKTTSLSRVLTNLESLGFIYRESSAVDKRSVKVFLTRLSASSCKLARRSPSLPVRTISARVESREIISRARPRKLLPLIR